jgi:hypothetical protein
MSHPLDRCWAKIERANENITNLEAEISAFTTSDSYRIERHVDSELREYTFRIFGPRTPLPPRIAVLSGEVIYHLRSSLDHLMWALVLRRHPNPHRSIKVQFPICTEWAEGEPPGERSPQFRSVHSP